MKRHLVVTLVLAACGGKQTTPAADDTEPVAFDAAPTPVVVATPDAEPPPPPKPPEVPAQGKTTDVAALEKLIKASSDDHDRLIWYGWIAEALWAQSCTKTTNGLCLKTSTRAKKAPPTCDKHTEDVTALGRPKKATDPIWKAIGAMRQLWGDGSILVEITDYETQANAYVENFYMAEEVAAALLILGDQELEQLYAIKAPVGLDFSGPSAKASVKKFDEWFQKVTAQATKASQTYELVVGDPSMQAWAPSGTVAAIARVADVYAGLANAINGLEISKDIQKDPDLVAAFCDTVSEKAEPLLVKGAETYGMCVSKADDLGVNNDVVVRCAAEAQRLKP